MSRKIAFLLVAVVLAVRATAATPLESGAAAGEKRPGPFIVDSLGRGIHLFRPAEGDSLRTNSLVVEREDGLLVVDAQPSPAAAKELLSAISLLTPKPVRFLVLTHPHADAAGGVSAFPANVLVIGSSACRDAMMDAAYDFGAEARSAAGTAWQEPERRPPTLVPTSDILLDDKTHPVRVIPIPAIPAHSRGDLIVSIPDAAVLAVGDLIAPLRAVWIAGGSVENWLSVLNGLIEEKPRIVAPLHGPAVDSRELRLTRDAFAWLRGQVAQAFVDQIAPGIMPDRILESPALAKYFDPAAPRDRVRATIEEVVREAQAYRKKRGLE
jgi:glyoxylase-like metal-dependent hydrolase (beta-lactamase superfamily II)